jgi:hypothetical protein
MGVTKNPLVKTTPKIRFAKRGRPVGSKNKPKIDPWDQMAKESVDWEKLAKQLQEALSSEMKENEALEKIVADFKSVIRLDSSFTLWDRLVFLFSGKL